MIPVRQFDSAEELLAHYRAVGARLNSGRRRPVLKVVTEEEPVVAPQPVPQPTVGELLDAFRLVCRQKVREQSAALDGEDFEPVKITIKLIAEFVSAAFQVSVIDLLSHRRNKVITQPRHAMFWLARHLTNRSLPDIGRRCGGRDHTTVLNGVNRCEEIMKLDPEYAEAVMTIKERLEALA